MGIFSKTKQKASNSKNTIWARYMKLIVPAVIALILLMDAVIYSVVAKNSKENMTKNCYSIVDHQCKLINGIFNCYIADMNMMRRSWNGNPEEFIEYCKEFITGNINQYTYVRLMLPDGTSYTTLGGKDPTPSTHRKPFKQIFEEGMDLSVNNAHPTDLSGEDIFSISIPIKERGKTVAIICSTFPASIIDDLLEYESEQNAPGFMALLDDSYYLRVYHSDTKTVHVEKLLELGFEGIDKTIYGGCEQMVSQNKAKGSGSYKTPDNWTIVCHYARIGDLKWFITLNMPLMVLNKDILITSIVLLITGILTIVVLLLIVKHITGKVIMEPLGAINRFTKDFANGKLYSTETRNITSKDELATVRDNIEMMQHKLVSVVNSIRKSTNEASSSSTSIKETVLRISEDAMVQSACVDEIRTSIDSLNQYIAANADLASHTKTNSDDIEVDIDMITMASDNTLESMDNVINKIKIINEISSRTDLLAINASVEAARAGDNGKGFAVVAAEIRKLAEHCQKASKEINELSSETLYVTQQSAEFIRNTIPKIHENAEEISQIAENCNQQMEMTQTISQAVNRLVDITSSNTQSSDDMQVSTQTLFQNMTELQKQMEFFKLDKEGSKQRSKLIAEIERHTSDILKLKSKLVEIAENTAETAVADTTFNEAIESAQKVREAESGSADGKPSDPDTAKAGSDPNDEFFNSGSTGSAGSMPKETPSAAKPNFQPKPENNLDNNYEEF